MLRTYDKFYIHYKVLFLEFYLTRLEYSRVAHYWDRPNQAYGPIY